MNALNDGGPAFPTQQGHCPDGTWNQTYDRGMSLRDWFAGMALPAKITEIEAWNDDMRNQGSSSRITKEEAADSCYSWADAMLAARNKEKP